MRLLVTGASGYIGSVLAPALREAGHSVDAPASRYQCSIKKLGSVPGCTADAIIHLAADTRGDYEDNIVGTAVVTAWPASGRVIFASSLTAQLPRDAYDAQKALGEEIVRARPDIEAVILRLGHVYGPPIRENRRSSFNAILGQIHRGESVHLYGNCQAQRDLTYIDDAVGAFVASLAAPPGIYDVGTGRGATLVGATQLAHSIAEATNWPTSDLSAPIADLPVAHPSRFIPGWSPQVSLEEGIRRTVSWLRESHPAREMVSA